MPAAVLFDIDGTLVDSNYLHLEAWSHALFDIGMPADAWRIHRAIGMDSGELLQRLLGDEAGRMGEEAKERHAHHYLELRPRLRVLPGARELVRALAGRGTTVVLATSAPPGEFAMLANVLRLEDAVAEYTTAEDAGTAKPAPDLVRVALSRAGVDAAEAVMVGDSVWDAQAAGRAGVRSIGLRSGGFGGDELTAAGAEAVYDDCADLLAGLDGSPLV